uniref:Uncharacterized protein n=1 Tax=Anopheles albimanus TaxID=7167 RepID=A0A182FXP1_ANOAL
MGVQGEGGWMPEQRVSGEPFSPSEGPLPIV